MRDFLTTIRRAAVLAAVGLTTACSTDSVTSPAMPEAAQPAIMTQGITTRSTATAEATVRTGAHLNPLRRDITRGATIGTGGGTIRIPETGFELVVPAGAVDKPTNFSVTAIAGSALAYEFQPHGTQFKVPLVLRQSVLSTSIGWGQTVGGGYFTDRSKLDGRKRSASVAEQMPARWKGSWIEIDIRHFSGYLVSCA